MERMSETSQLCPKCDGDGYQVYKDGAVAVATRCTCQTTCPVCQGSGFDLREDADGQRVAFRCRCRGLDARIDLFNNANIPARFANKHIDDIETGGNPSMRAMKQRFLAYRDSYQPGQAGFVLWGLPGVGKTHLLCGLLSWLTLERGISCRYVDFMQLLFDLKQGYSEGRWESDTVVPLLKADVLVIDELGKGRNSEWELAVLDELISHRYNSEKTLHGTSNYPPTPQKGAQAQGPFMEGGIRAPSTLSDRLGDRIYSRINEMCHVLEARGEDYRQGKNKAGRPQSSLKS